MTHELSPATNPVYIQTALREALQQPDLELRDLELLRHKPGRRALIAYTIARPGQPPQTLLGKQRVKGVDKHGYHIQRALWQQGFDLPGLAVPEALALLPDARLWLQRKAAGEPATRYLTPDSPPALWARIGAAIASLHRTNITTERRWNIADDLESAGRVATAPRDEAVGGQQNGRAAVEALTAISGRSGPPGDLTGGREGIVGHEARIAGFRGSGASASQDGTPRVRARPAQPRGMMKELPSAKGKPGLSTASTTGWASSMRPSVSKLCSPSGPEEARRRE